VYILCLSDAAASWFERQPPNVKPIIDLLGPRPKRQLSGPQSSKAFSHLVA